MERNDLIDRTADELEKNESLTGKDVRELLNSIPGIRRFIVACALRGLSARKYFFDRKTQTMQFEPDSATQLKAATFLAAYADGLPVQSTVQLNVDATSKGLNIGDALSNSPALRDYMRAELAKADAQKALPA